MSKDRKAEGRAVRFALLVGLVTLFGVLAYQGLLDDVGRAAGSLFGWLFK